VAGVAGSACRARSSGIRFERVRGHGACAIPNAQLGLTHEQPNSTCHGRRAARPHTEAETCNSAGQGRAPEVSFLAPPCIHAVGHEEPYKAVRYRQCRINGSVLARDQG
jgi:hypothetical protein